MKLKHLLLLSCFSFLTFTASAQDEDLLSELEDEEPQRELVTASYKTTRVVNSQSLENVAGGVLDIKISHRFGPLNSGALNLFGLDFAFVRLGADYGITNWLMIGAGRSSTTKTIDAFTKLKLLRQSTGPNAMPITLSWFSAMTLDTRPWAEPDRENFFTSRLGYVHQLIAGRKFSEKLTLQLMPTLVHRNLVATKEEKNDVMAIGAGGRMKLSKRTSFNAEYYHVLPDQLAPDFHNSLSIGFDIETGGHVFQLHITNSRDMYERAFITETNGTWGQGDIYFGFNIARVFTLKDPREMKWRDKE